jgi:hypothetical protein
MKKIILLIIFIITSINVNAANEKIEISQEEELVLWEKQNNYINNLKLLENELDIINEDLNKCREKYYNKVKENELKNQYMRATKDYSTQLIVTSTLLVQAISKIENKMQNNKELVLKGLIEYQDSIDDSLKKESERNKNIKLKMEEGLTEIQKEYCQD